MGTCVSSFFVGIRCAIARGKPLVGEKGLGYGALRGREQIAYSSPSKNTSSSGCWLWISCTFARTTVRESEGSSRSKRTWIVFATASAPRAGCSVAGGTLDDSLHCTICGTKHGPDGRRIAPGMTRDDVIGQFTRIPGVGETKARAIYEDGYASLQELGY